MGYGISCKSNVQASVDVRLRIKRATQVNEIVANWPIPRALLIICGSRTLALSPGPSQILSHSRGEKSGEGLGSKLHHRPEMVNSVSNI